MQEPRTSQQSAYGDSEESGITSLLEKREWGIERRKGSSKLIRERKRMREGYNKLKLGLNSPARMARRATIPAKRTTPLVSVRKTRGTSRVGLL